MDLGLKDKTAIVTGGSIGIGYAVAEALASEGVNVVICARNETRLQKAADELKEKFGTECLGIPADVTKKSDIDNLFSRVKEKFDTVNILVNNAGTGTNETIMDAEDEKWQHHWELHVMAAIRMARNVVPLMKKAGEGVIINNASICAKQPLGYEPVYNVTKSALVMFSKCLANELIPDNIRVNTINPGLVQTPDWVKTATKLGEKEGITAEQYLDRIAKENTPIGRFASPKEMADFFVFLCSPRASYCVGSTYYVDGGWLRTI